MFCNVRFLLLPLVFDELVHMVWNGFDNQNAQCIVNLCNKSPVVPHKCHPLIKTSTQLLYEATEPSNHDVPLTMARVMDDTFMVAYEGRNCRQRCNSV